MRRGPRLVLMTAGVAVLLGLALFVGWGLTPLGPENEALAAMVSGDGVTVQDEGEYLAFGPAGAVPSAGFVLYPGGHVDHRSYAPVARAIAARGYLVAVVKMPLSLAVLGPSRVDDVVAAHPAVRHWVVGGHSLGGTAAASYARTHADRVQGLALWASYPASGDDLSSTPLRGLSVRGSNDLVLDRETYNATLALLPKGTTVEVIEGGNHAQFGSYGPQPGDGIATISAADQQARAADLTADLLRAVAGSGA